MASEMVERVARAIDPDVWIGDLPVPTRAATVAFHVGRQRSIKQARAAIAAMRSPMEGMTEAGRVSSREAGLYPSEVITVFKAMIDAALNKDETNVAV